MALAAVDVAMAVAAVAPERALATAAVDFCIIVLEEEAAVAAAASSRSPSGDVAASTGAIGCAAVSGGSSKTTAGGVAGCASAGVDDGKSSCPFEWVPVGTASGVRAVLTLSFRDACTGHQTGSRRQQKGAQCRNAPAAVLAAHPISCCQTLLVFFVSAGLPGKGDGEGGCLLRWQRRPRDRARASRNSWQQQQASGVTVIVPVRRAALCPLARYVRAEDGRGGCSRRNVLGPRLASRSALLRQCTTSAAERRWPTVCVIVWLCFT
ncbi:MAG: hypothetical protein ACPIOQ_58325 [Promethearchaeia archaeon]